MQYSVFRAGFFLAILGLTTVLGCATSGDLDNLRADFNRNVLQLDRSIGDLQHDVSRIQSDQKKIVQSVDDRIGKCESKVSEMSDRIAEMRIAFIELIESLRKARGSGFLWEDPTKQSNTRMQPTAGE